MRILATVAARGGSKGVKNKNIRNLLGKPLIAYTIEQVIEWNKFEKFIVSTDSQKIADISRHYGAEVPFMRPSNLASDTVGKIEVLRHSLIEAEKYYNTKFETLLDLDATAPIRTVEDIENIVNIFKEKRPDCIFSVVKAHKNPYFNIVEEKENGTVTVSKQLSKVTVRRQDAPVVYDINASMYVYDRQFLLDPGNKMPYSKKTLIYKMGDLSGTDIDNEIDFKYIEFLVKEGILNNKLQ